MQYRNLYCNQCCTRQRYRLSVAIFCVRWHGLNELKGRWLLTVKELQKTIMEKGRMLYERITGYFRGDHEDFQISGRHAGHSGERAVPLTAGTKGESETDRDESEVAGREREGSKHLQRSQDKGRLYQWCYGCLTNLCCDP